MIGTPPVSNNLSRLYFDNADISDLVSTLENHEYSKESGFGFSIEHKEPSLVSAYLLLSRPVKKQVYDSKSGSVVEKEIKTVDLTPFRVDSRYGFLEVFADQSSVTNLVNKIGQVTNRSIKVESVTFAPEKIHREIDKEYRTELTSIKLSNYSLSNSVVGNVQIEIEDQNRGLDLIDTYRGDISYLGIRVKTNSSDVTFGVYDSGSILVYNDTDELDSLLDLVKSSLSSPGDY